VEQEVGYVDVLINNAGVPGPDDMAANTAETIEELQSILLGSPGGLESTFAINTSALRRVCAAFLKLLDGRNRRRENPS
jgi:NAD(P)-dependent dehydrogenase (short-subunit alcohol dehydrogenase family)